MEVSNVAGDLARLVLTLLKLPAEQIEAAVAICATCGLIHDLGNPPFGHSGETAIREWVNDCLIAHYKMDLASVNADPAYQDLLRFEGNAQTIRLVARLQVMNDFHGLNLTFATLGAVSKYLASSVEVDENRGQAWRKVGYFATERELIQTVRERTGTGAARHPLAYIVEAADDICYSVVDLEDAGKKNILVWGDVKQRLQQTDPKDPIIASVIEWVDGFKLEHDPSPIQRSHVRMNLFRTKAISESTNAVGDWFLESYEAIMAGTFRDSLLKQSRAKALAGACKQLGRDRVYNTAETLRLELMGRRVIKDLLSVMFEGARSLSGDVGAGEFGKRAGSLISENYRQVFHHEVKGGTSIEPHHVMRLAVDYVAGMTDSYACTLHRQLFNG